MLDHTFPYAIPASPKAREVAREIPRDVSGPPGFEIRGLVKRFDGKSVLQGVDLVPLAGDGGVEVFDDLVLVGDFGLERHQSRLGVVGLCHAFGSLPDGAGQRPAGDAASARRSPMSVPG